MSASVSAGGEQVSGRLTAALIERGTWQEKSDSYELSVAGSLGQLILNDYLNPFHKLWSAEFKRERAKFYEDSHRKPILTILAGGNAEDIYIFRPSDIVVDGLAGFIIEELPDDSKTSSQIIVAQRQLSVPDRAGESKLKVINEPLADQRLMYIVNTFCEAGVIPLETV